MIALVFPFTGALVLSSMTTREKNSPLGFLSDDLGFFWAKCFRWIFAVTMGGMEGMLRGRRVGLAHGFRCARETDGRDHVAVAEEREDALCENVLLCTDAVRCHKRDGHLVATLVIGTGHHGRPVDGS